MKKSLLTTAILMGACLLCQPGIASASLYSWSSTPTIEDGVDGVGTSGQEILNAWHATDGTYHYFRIDLASAPTASSFAGLYGIYIDSQAGGANGAGVSYVPNALNGIDYIVDSHYDPNMGGYIQHDYHYGWDGTNFAVTRIFEGMPDLPEFAYQHTENGGATLEWKVTAADIGSDFTWWAATHDMGSAVASYDVAGPAASPVPLPASAWLFTSGVIGLAGFRRNRKS